MPREPENSEAGLATVPEEVTGQLRRVVAGAFSHWFGVPWTVATGALVCGAAAVVTWSYVRRTPAAPE